MEKFLLILLYFQVSSSEKHFLKLFSVGCFGIPNFPDFVGIAEVDGIQYAYCGINKKIEPRQHWMKNILESDQNQMNWYKTVCSDNQPAVFKDRINYLMQNFNQSEGVHVLQRIHSVEWDDETGEVKGFIKYGYDGEDFILFNVKNLTWIALKPEALTIILRWDTDEAGKKEDEIYLTQIWPEWLKKYVDVGKSSLMRKVLPSVSLLQKSPSSPITCHATGFYPNSAVLFWRKDGEELFEDVEHGEILPNMDGSFQMSVELLKLPSEDWGKYECVFLLSGVKEDMVTKLEKSVIRTNYKVSTDVAVAIGVGLPPLIVVFVAAVVGFMFYRRCKVTEYRTEEPETLNQSSSLNSPSCKQKHHNNEEEETLNTEPVT